MKRFFVAVFEDVLGVKSATVVSGGDGSVWVCEYDGVFDNEGNPLSDEGFSSLERAKAIVGGEFQTWLYIHPNDLGLSIRFAHACCQRWPCVIETDAKRLYSCKEIEQLYQEEGGMI